MEIKCTCGNKGCTTKLNIYGQSNYADIRITHIEKGEEKTTELMLDPTAIVYLISQLKAALAEMG